MSGPADDEVAKIAQRLYEAEQTRTPIRQLSLEYPDMTIEDAYAVQRALVALKVADGREVKGRKIGLTSKVMQRAVSIDEPDYGALFDDMFIEDGGRIPLGRYIRPRVEVELAFVLGEELSGPGVTLFDVLRATEFVTPALEILDARVQMSDPDTGHLRTIVDTIADNAAAQVWSWAGECSVRWTSTCDGWRPCYCATARSRSQGWPPRCSTIPATAWPGWPIDLPRMGFRWSAGRSSCRGRSPSRFSPNRVTASSRTTGRWARCR